MDEIIDQQGGARIIWLGGTLDNAGIRQLDGAGSLSRFILGGAPVGTGKLLARGCASRLLIRSSTVDLRALVAVLMLTVVAPASLRGYLSPMREVMAAWWTVSGGER